MCRILKYVLKYTYWTKFYEISYKMVNFKFCDIFRVTTVYLSNSINLLPSKIY